MSVFAFIFARGGSKGLVKKNIKSLGGIPLIGHSISLAAQMPVIEKVYVSTDSPDIMAIAREFSAEVIERPIHLATDTASEWEAWRHAVNHVRATGEQFETFLSLPATSPLRSIEDVQKCLDAIDDQTDVVITVTPSARSPYFNMIKRDAAGFSTIVATQNGTILRRQDAPEVFDITTVAYVSRPDFILKQTGLFAGRVKSVIVPKERAIDIDDAFDFMIAETLFKSRNYER